MSSLRTEVTHAIMRAFFNREPDENGDRIFTISPVDNEDLALAALRAVRNYPNFEEAFRRTT